MRLSLEARRWILMWTSLFLLLWPTVYVGMQQPRLSLNSERFGLILMRGGYRSWFLRFSDGHTFDQAGKWRSVVIGEDHWRYGYRIIPQFSHCDLRAFMRTHPEFKVP